mgnify:CR=1 FL=1
MNPNESLKKEDFFVKPIGKKIKAVYYFLLFLQ